MAICYCCFKIQKPFSLSFLLAHRAGEAEPFPEGGYLTHLPPPCTIPQTISSTWPTPSHPTGISIGVPSSRKPSLVPPPASPQCIKCLPGFTVLCVLSHSTYLHELQVLFFLLESSMGAGSILSR